MSKYRKYKEINHTLLTNHSDMSLYWLGFIAADGTVMKNSLNIQLASKDLDHIIKFKQHMLLENPIKKRITKCNGKLFKSNSITIFSKTLITELANYHITQNKSKTLIFPQLIKKLKNKNSFIRGYIDGDGGFTRNNNSTKLYLTGRYDFLNTIRSIIIKECNLPDSFYDKKITKNRSVFSLEFADKIVCKQIINWLYNGSIENELFLLRKYNKIKDLIDGKSLNLKHYKSLTPIGSTVKKTLTKQHLEKLYKKHKTITGIAKSLNITNRTVSKYMNKFSIPYKKMVPKKQTDKVSEKEIRAAIVNIKTIRGLSRFFNCSRGLIKNRLKKYNLTALLFSA